MVSVALAVEQNPTKEPWYNDLFFGPPLSRQKKRVHRGEIYVHPYDFGRMVFEGTILLAHLYSVGNNDNSTMIIIRMVLGGMI